MITLIFHNEVTLELDEVFPDGVPEDLELRHVIDAIEDDGGPLAILDKWNLADNLTTTVFLADGDYVESAETVGR